QDCADAAREVFADGSPGEVEFAVLAFGVADDEAHFIGAGGGLEHAGDSAQQRFIGEHVIGLEDGDDEAGGIAAYGGLDARPGGFGRGRRLGRWGAMSVVAGTVRMVPVPVRRAVPSGSGGSGGGARRAVAPTGRIRVDSPASLRRFRDLPLFGGEANHGAFGRIVGRGLAHVEADAVPALADFEGDQEDLAFGPELFASELKRVAPDRDFGRTGEIFDINDVELAAIASGAGLDTIH